MFSKMLPKSLKSKFPVELRLLLSLCQISQNEERIGKIESLLHESIGWDKFLALVDYHRLDSTVYKTIKNSAVSGIPDNILLILKRQCTNHSIRMMKLTGELIRLLKLFRNEKIKAMPLKGPALSLQIYNNLNCRRSNDLDILVSQEDFPKAEFLLGEMGYHLIYPHSSLSEKKRKHIQKNLAHFGYQNSEQNIHVELHWSPSKNPYFNIHSIWPKLKQIKVADLSIPVMEENDTFLYLCHHGSKHNWRRLFWLYDIAALIRKNHNINWSVFLNKANNTGLERCVVEGVYLSHYLFETSLPKPVETQIRKSSAVVSMASISLKFIQSPSFFLDNLPFIHIKRKSLLTRTSKRQFVLFMERFAPGAVDFQIIKLPDNLMFLYYVLRPFFVLWRKLRILVTK